MTRPPIEPDTKDWTWVLREPCPECGFDAEEVAPAEVPDLVRDYAQRWQAVLARPDAATRSDPQVWSASEYGCHVRDVFNVFAGRVRLMLEHEAPTFENWDQDATALADGYADQDPAVVAQQLAVTAEDAATAFASVRGEGWQRTGVRSNGSEFTVESLARYFVHDVVHHLHDVRG